MKSGLRFLIPVVFLGLVLVACTPCDPTFYQPQNTSPPHNSITDSLRPTLTWDYEETACLPEEFIINLFTNATNGTITASGFGGPTGSPEKSYEPPADLTTGVAYLWSVATKNGTVIGPYSNQWQFVVGPICETVDLLAPDNVEPAPSSTVTTTDPKYIWSYPDPSCSPEGYHLQVSELSDFSTLTVDLRQTDPAKGWTTGILLDDCENYYWRVAAINGPDDGPWSTATEFNVNTPGSCLCTLPELEVIELIPIWPGPWEVVPDFMPVLEWSFPGSCEVGGYSVHLSDEPAMEDSRLFGGSSSESWTPRSALEPLTSYWWEVAAGVDTEFGPYSERLPFLTGPECSSTGDVGAPSLVSPEQGEAIEATDVALQWDFGPAGCIPDGVVVDLQTDSNFAGVNLLEEYDVPMTQATAESLEDCTTHFWRVAAVQDGTFGPFSETRWFRTNESPACLFTYYPGWVLENVNCRLCGDERCRIRMTLQQGMIAEIVGRSPDSLYYKIRDPNGEICYVLSRFVDAEGGEEMIEPVRMPPTPTLVPTDTPEPEPPRCHSDLSQDECPEAGGKWNNRTESCDCPD